MVLKYFLIKEEVQKHNVSIELISTNLMITNLLMKELPNKIFAGHSKRMGLIDSNEWLYVKTL